MKQFSLPEYCEVIWYTKFTKEWVYVRLIFATASSNIDYFCVCQTCLSMAYKAFDEARVDVSTFCLLRGNYSPIGQVKIIIETIYNASTLL